jgi:hypothetical protein
MLRLKRTQQTSVVRSKRKKIRKSQQQAEKKTTRMQLKRTEANWNVGIVTQRVISRVGAPRRKKIKKRKAKRPKVLRMQRGRKN